MHWLEIFISWIPSGTVLLCTVLSFVIPYAVYRVNQALHRHGDPPWKRGGQ